MHINFSALTHQARQITLATQVITNNYLFWLFSQVRESTTSAQIFANNSNQAKLTRNGANK